MNNGTAAIQTRALTKHYGRKGEIKALQSLDLEIRHGELFGFLGPNGAGKSTTIRTLLGLLHPTSGSASVLGLDVVKDSVALRRRVGYLPSGFAVYDYMSGREYLDHMRELSGRPSLLRHRITEALELSDATLKRPVRDYSRGMRQKIGIVQAMETDPELLILDEPSEGLDPLMQRSLHELLLERVALGRTVFFSSHLISEVERICSRVAIVRGGRLVAVSFDPHPVAVLRPAEFAGVLTLPKRRAELLRTAGADCVEFLTFDEKLRSMSADEFVDDLTQTPRTTFRSERESGATDLLDLRGDADGHRIDAQRRERVGEQRDLVLLSFDDVLTEPGGGPHRRAVRAESWRGSIRPKSGSAEPPRPPGPQPSADPHPDARGPALRRPVTARRARQWWGKQVQTSNEG